jgi:glycosyltransferase involved in cell wall biosynthesis
MKRILIIALSEIQRDPRVMRQIAALRDEYELTVAGYGDAPEGASDFILLPRKLSQWEKLRGVVLLASGAYESFYWQNHRMQTALATLRGRTYDLVLANDVDVLLLALTVADSAPVLLDAHEYAPRQFEDRLVWKTLFQPYVEYLCSTYLPKTAAMFAVCQGIAEEYKRRYGVDPIVVTNASVYVDLEPTDVEPNCIRMIHHGRSAPSRYLEGMIEMFAYLDDRFRLDFMLLPSNKRYLKRIRRLASSEPRIRFIDPVPMPEISARINAYDVGLFLLPPSNFNYRYALPNKFFEYIQARLAVAIGPSPEMVRYVREFDVGVASDTFEPGALAAKLNGLDAQDIGRMKEASHCAAKILHAENSKQCIRETVDNLIGKR